MEVVGWKGKGSSKNTSKAKKKEEASRPPRKKKREKDFPPEKKGRWTRKEQRQGEADNPGPTSQEVFSDDEDIPALIQEEESELEECDWTEDSDEEDSEAEFERHRATLTQDIAKA